VKATVLPLVCVVCQGLSAVCRGEASFTHEASESR